RERERHCLATLRLREANKEPLELVEQPRMGILLLKETLDKLRRVEAEVHRAQIPAECAMSVAQAPFGEDRKIALRSMGKDGVATVEQIQPAVEVALAGLGAPDGALGNEPEPAVLSREEGDDLRRLAVRQDSETDG